MSSWDDLPPERQAAISAYNRRHHSAVNREQAVAIDDARTLALNFAVDFLISRGFVDAAAALEGVCFVQEGGKQ